MTTANQTIRIGRLTDCGEAWEILGTYSTYDAADEALEGFCERFPFAYIDILDGALSHVQTV